MNSKCQNYISFSRRLLSKEVVEDTHAQMVECQEFTSHAHFNALQKALEREDPSFLA